MPWAGVEGVVFQSCAPIEKATARVASLVLQRYLRSERHTRAKASTELVLASRHCYRWGFEAHITGAAHVYVWTLTYQRTPVNWRFIEVRYAVGTVLIWLFSKNTQLHVTIKNELLCFSCLLYIHVD
jgi:hypothetical protein